VHVVVRERELHARHVGRHEIARRADVAPFVTVPMNVTRAGSLMPFLNAGATESVTFTVADPASPLPGAAYVEPNVNAWRSDVTSDPRNVL